MNKREIGTCYEKLAVTYLRQRGLKILDCNYRCKYGEIDIIAKEEGVFVFCEVKYRKEESRGNPLEAVTRQKQKTICRCALMYLTQIRALDREIRFDVIGILGEEIIWVKQAFEYQG